MIRILLRLIAVLVGLGLLAAGGLAAYTNHLYRKSYHPPYPALVAAVDVARGRRLFQTACAQCHVDEAAARAHGKRLPDYPSFMGEFYASNLTSDPHAGIGAWTDAALGRLIRTGVARDGHLRAMPVFPRMGDGDVAALVGFLRSPDPLLAPDGQGQPPTRVSLAGTFMFVWGFGIQVDAPPSVPMPPVAVSADYGRYMATFYDCWQCHSDGYSRTKLDDPNLYAGGFEWKDAQGRTLYSPNITFDENALGAPRWTLSAFKTALRDGVNPDGTILRFPMPRYRWADDVDLEAIFAYLKSVTPSKRPRRPGTLPATKPSTSSDPAVLWHDLGCAGCHGLGAPFRAAMDRARALPVGTLARFIRSADRVKPGTQMPTYASVLDEARAQALAGWLAAAPPP